MALRDEHPNPRNDATSVIAGGEGNEFYQDEEGVLINRTGATAAESDFDIDSLDISGGVVLSEYSDNDFDGEYPNIGGTSEIGVYLESSDDSQFEIKVHIKDEDGNSLAVIDKFANSKLESASPTNGNHHIFASVLVVGDIMDIEFVDTSNSQSNEINGSINAH